MASDTKQRMIEAAAVLIQSGGLAAASFTDVLDASGAARGAIYHHFPGGKAELAHDAVSWTGERVREHFAAIDAATPSAVVARFLAAVRPVAKGASAGVSCAVAAVTVESGQSDVALTQAVDAAFASWVLELESQLLSAGAEKRAARSVAVLLITFLEGTQILCRAAGSVRPFDDAAAALKGTADALFS